MFHVEHGGGSVDAVQRVFHVEQSRTPPVGVIHQVVEQCPLSFGIAPAELPLIGLEPAGVVLC